jgi:NtrC-family two-component system sensor histidine kinase KinB
MGWLRSGLSRRFAAVMGVLALAPVLFLSWRMMQASRRGVQDAVLELHVKLAEKSAERVAGWVDSVDGRVQIALLALQARMDWPEKQALLKHLVESGSEISSVTLLRRDAGGAILMVFNPDLADAVTPAELRKAREAMRRAENGEGRLFEVVRGEKGPRLVIYYPFSKEIFARVSVPLRGIAERVAQDRVGGTGFGVLVDGTGAPLAVPEGRALDGMESWAITRAALAGGTSGSSEFADRAGRAFVGAYAPVPKIGGAVLILQARDEAYLAASEARRAAAVAIAVVIFGSLLAAAILARLLTAPVLKLTRAAEAVSRGDFETRVDITTGDELQELAETFNAMTARLRQYSVLQVDRLIAEQRKTEAILFSIREGIVMADREGKVRLVNRRAGEMFGLSSDSGLEGKNLAEAFPSGALRAALLAAGEKPGESKEVDLSTETVRLFIRVTASPVVTPGRGAELGTVYALRDVTLERELEKMKEDFLHYITHDLRNPLGSAIGFLDLLLKGTAGVLNADQQNIVSSVRRSTTRLMGLINNILDIAKMESGRLRLQLKTTSLAGIAGRSIGILEQLAKAKRLSVHLVAVEEFSVQADADMLERVFTNLLGNAIKYTPEGGTITIALSDDGGAIRCRVEDTGEGIPPDYLDRVFEKFEQVQGNRKGGTGLGLTISRFFVEAHLGRLWVESQVGKGSSFIFTVPKNLVAADDGGVKVAEAAA